MRVVETDVETVTFVSDDLDKIPAVNLEAVTGGRRGIPGGCKTADASVTHADQAANLVGCVLSCVCNDGVGITSGNADC